ncbi:YqeG family HAD IIIA-type phosphatase [Nostoc spongiaeforme FACHB-130]|uniref:YqeG family HAD IIIA-type phosphatase n=1 Tax=Nostoc spongiaeforme FACHB-130 TaxID=1357510 RepID=A0ABR8FRE5_9NOSO|nr:YqeG family HAD IIIA-type phosphatase [Nostoc spongiaeforme]MBD2593977.1 YqeG family HAD IIIA-type phosphatase [Nostoc spongiaeforme FACHB-130]
MRHPTTILRKLFSTFGSWLCLSIKESKQPGFKKKSNSLQQYVHTLAQIEIDQIQTCGIKGIILDLDNTIISEDDRFLSSWAEDWIVQAKLAGLQFFILSNGKRRYRVKFWSHRLDIPSLSPAKKPFPLAFRHAMAHMRLPAKQVVVIGDSLHTDFMGAWLCGCRFIQVASLPHPPRWWEKLASRWVQRPYPDEEELWNFDPDVDYESFF